MRTVAKQAQGLLTKNANKFSGFGNYCINHSWTL